MLWQFNDCNPRMYIPGLTRNKDAVKCIKLLCTRKGENKTIFHMKHYKVIKPFPENSSHYLTVNTYNAFFMHGDGSRDEWTEMQIMHFIGNWNINIIFGNIFT